MKKILTKIKHRLKGRHQKFYHHQNDWWLIHIVTDLMIILIIFFLITSDLILYVSRPAEQLKNYFSTANIPTASTTKTIIKTKYQPTQPELNFKALAKYHLPEGDQIGVGPIPPQVSETTKYWIFFSVASSNGNFSNLKAQGILGENVRFTGKTLNNSGYVISINADNNSLSWQVDEINKEDLLPIISAVEVEIKPTEDQLNKKATLLSQIEIIARDQTNKKTIIKKIQTILTEPIIEDSDIKID